MQSAPARTPPDHSDMGDLREARDVNPVREAGATTARVATRLVVATLVLLALLPPLAWAALGLLMLQRESAADLERLAWAQGRLEAAGPLAAHSVSVRDAHGRVLARRGTPTAAPTWRAGAALPPESTAAPRPDGGAHHVQVERSLRPLLASTLLAALAGATAAFAMWWLAYRRPVGALRQAERRILSHARLDRLTGLLNREGLRERLQLALQRQARSGRISGVLVIDIDRFARINTLLGQHGGDQLLNAIADRLRGLLRQADGLGRITGDQFAFVVEDINYAQSLSALARNLHRAFEAPFMHEGREIVVALSIGGALAQGDTLRPDLLLRDATAAMRAAKGSGNARYRLFEAELKDDSAERMELDLKLRRALAMGQFFLMYQPIVDAHGRGMVAAEALLRWADPDRGVVSPAAFIPVLEETGLIVPVGQWVLLEACRRGRQWMDEGAEDIVISVNLSPRQFAEPDFLDRLAGVLRSSGLPAAQLQLEVTEGLLLEPTQDTLRRIDEIAAMGVRLAVDDFGMGYSSLAYLKRFKLHTLKIDRLFVRDVARNEQDLAIVRAIIELGHSLNMKITAEGVETEDQAHALRRLGCDTLQGYLFAKPMLASEMRSVAPVSGLAGAAEAPSLVDRRARATGGQPAPAAGVAPASAHLTLPAPAGLPAALSRAAARSPARTAVAKARGEAEARIETRIETCTEVETEAETEAGSGTS